MDSKVAAFGATPDPTHGQSPPPSRPEPSVRTQSAPATADPADLRLVIEQDQATGTYIYKTVNRTTGEVVLQLPREQILKMQERVEYVAGTLIRASA